MPIRTNKRKLQIFNRKQYHINIPIALVAAKGWKEKDILEFIIDEKGNLIIRKAKDDKK